MITTRVKLTKNKTIINASYISEKGQFDCYCNGSLLGFIKWLKNINDPIWQYKIVRYYGAPDQVFNNCNEFINKLKQIVAYSRKLSKNPQLLDQIIKNMKFKVGD